MRKIIFLLLVTAGSFLQQSFAQTNSASPINNVVSSYMNIKNGLISNNAKIASKNAKIMLDEIDKVKTDNMTAEQKSVWNKYTEKLSYDATHISEVPELDHDREHFMSLSKNMYNVVKSFPVSTPVYYQFCPMANGSKGAYWLSEEDTIHNPYFGDKMNGCPSTKETIETK